MRLFLSQINKVILVITIFYFLITTAFGFLPPFFAVFITQQKKEGSVAVVGLALTIYWITKSVLQLFVARYIDRNHGEIDDFYFFVVGGLMNSILVSLYYFASDPWHIYMLHFLIGIGDAMLVPPFYAIFTRHIDKGKEAFEWSLFSSFSVGAGSALGAMIGGFVPPVIGFRAVFPLIGLITFIATLILFFMRPYIQPKTQEKAVRIFIDGKKI